MSLLGVIGGMIPTAYQGYQKGVDDELSRQDLAKQRSLADAQRQAATTLLPLQTDAAAASLTNQANDSKFKASIAPQQQALTKADLDSQTELAPGKAELAKRAQQMDLDKSIYDQVESVYKGAQTADAAQESINAIAGKAISSNDMDALTRVFGHMHDAPGVFPALNSLPKPVKSQIVDAPEGALDLAGKPITGKAIKLTLEDGSTRLANPAYATQAYQKQLEAQRIANIKVTKPGEVARDGRTGEVLWDNPEKLMPGFTRDADGNIVQYGNYGKGGAGGTGAGAGGKGAKEPTAQAVTAFTNIAEKSDAKLPPEQFAMGQEFASRLMSQGAESPEQAARVALDIAKKPPTLSDYKINPATGTVDRVYSSPDFANGRTVVVKPAEKSVDELASAVEPGVMANAATAQLQYELSKVAPEQQAAAKAQWMKLATDPAARAQALQQISSTSGPEAAKAYQNKLNLIAKYLPKDGQAAQQSTISTGFGLGGSPSQGQAGPVNPGTPPEIADRIAKARADATAAATKSAAAKAQTDAASAKAKAESAWITPEAISHMTPEEAEGYLGKYGKSLAPKLLRQLYDAASVNTPQYQAY